MFFRISFLTILFFTTIIFAEEKIIDSDNDSISDKYDKCPNTPDGVCVTQDGCIKQMKWIINFDSSSYIIQEQFKKKLNSLNEIGDECFGYKIMISGHTDSTANEKYNHTLSKNRAKAIEKYLIQNGIDKKRITSNWFGETLPTATNVTKEGRYLNRRVEILFK